MDDTDRDALISSVVLELRRPVRAHDVAGADFTDRLMARVDREPVPGAGGVAPIARRAPRAGAAVRALLWAARPRTVRLSPLVGLAAAAGIAALAVLVTPEKVVRVREEAPAAAMTPVAQPAPADQQDSIEFVLHAPDARSVAVAGDFNDWNATVHPLARRDGGLWVARVPLAAGRYEYTFVVDGSTWTPDPAAPPAPTGDFGATNSVLVVGGVQ